MLESIGEDDLTFTPFEVEQILKDMNPKKSPGIDGLTSDICLQAFLASPDTIVSMFNACLRLSHFPSIWKDAKIKVIPKPGRTDYTQLKSFRPIGLINVWGKVLEKLLSNRIQYHIRQQRGISERQFGFTAQKSTEDAIHELIDLALDKRKENIVALISLDIEGAFDNAWWPHLLNELRRQNTPNNLLRLTRSYLTNRKVRVDYAGSEVNKSTTKGCIQGSTCGPFFFNVVLNPLLIMDFDINVHIQAFADDVSVMVYANKERELETRINRTLDVLHKWGRSVKLNFSESKTQVMFFKMKDPNITITMNGRTLQPVDDITLLGVKIDKNLKWIRHANAAIAKAAGVAKQLLRIAKPTWGATPGVLQTIYHQACEPMITYAASVWGDAVKYKCVQKKLNQIQRLLAQQASKAFKTTSLNATQVIAGFMPLDIKIRQLASIGRTKRSSTLDSLPSDRTLQRRHDFYALPHPATRNPETVTYDGVYARGSQSRLEIFTDGSKIDNKVGAGVVFYVNDIEISKLKLKLADYCSVQQAEMLAISEALKWTQKQKRQTWSEIALFTDSRSSVDAIANVHCLTPLIVEIRQRSSEIKSNGTPITFNWIRGHTDIYGNEIADKLAKDATLNSKRSTDYADFPIAYAKHHFKQIAEIEWNTRYQTLTTGETTRLFFPTLKDAKLFFDEMPTNYYLTQMLTGHGVFRSALKRWNLREDERCPCGHAKQDVTHLINDCHIFAHERSNLERTAMNANVPLNEYNKLIERPETRNVFVEYLIHILKSITKINAEDDALTPHQPIRPD